MEISYRNSFWDYVQFTLYTTLRSKLSLIFIVPALFILGDLALDAWRTTQESSLFVRVIVFSIFFIVGLVAFLLLVLVIILIGSFVMYAGRNVKWDQAKIQATENGFTTEASVGRSEVQWSGVKAIKQNKRLIFIFISTYMAFIVPKHAFAQETDANKFFTYINELWEKHKR